MPDLRLSWRKTPSGGGFTLIELLVVISIISMLMSIMLPGLDIAREMGRRVVCSSGMRQLTIAWYQYALENDDTLCSPDTGFNDRLLSSDEREHCNWVADGPDNGANLIGGTRKAIEDGVLFRYVSETVKIYKCKSDRTELLRSYSISNTMGGYNCGCGNMTRPYTSLSNIKNPSNKLVFIDADSVLPAGDIKWINGSFWPVSSITPGLAAWAVPANNNITGRHGDGTNVSFADGHVDFRRWKEYETIEIANWNFSYNGGGDDNIDIEYLLEVLKGPND